MKVWGLSHRTSQPLGSARTAAEWGGGRSSGAKSALLEGSANQRSLPAAQGRLPGAIEGFLSIQLPYQGADQRLGAYICHPTTGLLHPPHIRQVLQPADSGDYRGPSRLAAAGRGGRGASPADLAPGRDYRLHLHSVSRPPPAPPWHFGLGAGRRAFLEARPPAFPGVCQAPP